MAGVQDGSITFDFGADGKGSQGVAGSDRTLNADLLEVRYIAMMQQAISRTLFTDEQVS